MPSNMIVKRSHDQPRTGQKFHMIIRELSEPKILISPSANRANFHMIIREPVHTMSVHVETTCVVPDHVKKPLF